MSRVRSHSFLALSMMALPWLGACETNPLGHGAPSHFSASIDGSITADYQGTGQFRKTFPRGLLGFSFWLDSHGRGTAGNQRFAIEASAQPGVGIHQLGDPPAPGTQWITARYSIRDGNIQRDFVAESGELVITKSTANRVEGTLSFSATLARECDVSRPNFTQCANIPVGSERPTIQVSGAFEAAPYP